MDGSTWELSEFIVHAVIRAARLRAICEAAILYYLGANNTKEPDHD